MNAIIKSLVLLFVLSVFSCRQKIEPKTSISQEVKIVATDFFETFSARKDWNKLLSFYSPEMKFEDVLLQMKLDSFEQFKEFYNWPDPNFSKLAPDQKHLEVETLVANDNRVAVARGHFNPFMWQGERIEPSWGMEFTIWLYFDENMKIVRQVDWIEYDDRVLESVIKRIREEADTPSQNGMD